MATISIIIPIYNSISSIAKCIDSILAQTFEDYEVLLIDDGSTDGSNTYCKSIAEKDSRFKFYGISHRGVSAARNKGLDHAHGTYICFIDSDDYIESNMLELIIDSSIALESAICTYGYFTDKSNISSPVIFSSRESTCLNEYEFLPLLFLEESINGFVWNKLYLRSFIGNTRFHEDVSVCEDLIFNVELISKIKQTKSCSISILHDSLYHYVQTPSSATHASSFFVNHQFIYKKAFLYIEKMIPEFNIEIQKKYYDILQYHMYLLCTQLNTNNKRNIFLQTQIRDLKKELKNFSKHSSLSFLTKKEKVRFYLIQTAPLLYYKLRI